MKKHNFTIRFSDEEISWLKEEAQAQQRSVGNLITYVLSLYRKEKSERNIIS